MGKMYLLSGTTGDWEDLDIWGVGIFYCKKKAEKRCDRLNEILKKYEIHTDNIGSTDTPGIFIPFYKRKELEDRFIKLDKNFRIDFFTGVSYFTEEFKVYDEFSHIKGIL